MSNLSKIGIIVIFLGALLLAFQFIHIFDDLTSGSTYRKIGSLHFSLEAAETIFPTRNNSEIMSNKKDIAFLVEGKLSSSSIGCDFDLGKIYCEDGTIKATLFKEGGEPLFIIKPPTDFQKGISLTEEYPLGYLIEPSYPEDLEYQDFNISFNYDALREYIYNGSGSDGYIKNDIIEKDGGITISAVRKMSKSFLSNFQGIMPLIISIVIISAGVLLIVFGILKNKKRIVYGSTKEDMELAQELEDASINVDGEINKNLQQMFRSINSRLKRIIKLSKDTKTINLSEIVTLGKELANNSIILAKFMMGFSTIKNIANIEQQAFELDELKIKYTSEPDFTKKTEILSKIKAKERILFFLQNIERKAEQIFDMIANVDALLESTILAFPSMKRDASVSSSSSIAGIRRKLSSEIEIQHKEIEMLEEVVKSSKKTKQID